MTEGRQAGLQTVWTGVSNSAGLADLIRAGDPWQVTRDLRDRESYAPDYPI